MTGAGPVPYEDWIDEEWLRIVRTVPPDTPVHEVEIRVAEWRLEDT
jgi:hypothetical protein